MDRDRAAAFYARLVRIDTTSSGRTRAAIVASAAGGRSAERRPPSES